MLKYETGKYVWVYELPMTKSFFLLFEAWKVLALAALAPMTVIALTGLFGGDGLSGVLFGVEMAALVFGIMFVLSIPAYWIVTKANNGKYTVLFEMDENGISHTQIKTDKAKILDSLTMMAGAATRNYSTMGAGMLSASGGSLYSNFLRVRVLKAYPKKHLIRVNGRFVHNQVYVDDEDFDFVWEFIRSHCINAVVK